MKVKQRPEDFIVEELTDVTAGDRGEFAFYRLDKTGWTTPDALVAIRRLWNIDLQRLSYGGLKDRHATTTQYISIYHGPQENLRHERIDLEYLGRIPYAYSSQQIFANRFTITLRSLTPPDLDRIATAAKQIETCGVPNYFDDQRFGSVTEDNRFIALELIRGQFEEALKLALAAPYEFDRAEDKQEKAILRQYWGQWPECKAKLQRSHARSLVDFLCQRPGDTKGAVARLRPELSGMYLSAYQSHVWNRMLARWLTVRSKPESLTMLETRMGPLPSPMVSCEGWESLELPLPSNRMKNEVNDDIRGLIDAVLAEDGITLDKMKVPGMQKPYFSKGLRIACLKPEAMAMEPGDDELNRGRKSMTLRFELPRGAYATMVIKRITAGEP
ncbi:tRNA pseudouridine(13) synthase TruD [soil metagenome]